MKLNNLLINLIQERYINLHTKADLKKYIDEIWNLIQETYKPIGGYLAADSPEELIEKVGFAKLFRYNDKIIAVALYKSDKGRKAIGKACDGSKEGKEILRRIILDDVVFTRAWGEFSGALEHLYLKNGGVPVPNTLAAKILGKKIDSLDPDGYHYERNINGKLVKKIIIGTINGTPD